jgi:hypothetical protein
MPGGMRLTLLRLMAVTIQRHVLGVTWVEQSAMARAGHGLLDDGRVWLIDPYEDAIATTAIASGSHGASTCRSSVSRSRELEHRFSRSR